MSQLLEQSASAPDDRISIGASAGSAGNLKVFISYSRSDVGFADELELALRDKGHEPLVDRHGIDAGEDWRKRLSELIFACDTVVFVLTNSSAASSVCAWEVEEAGKLGKRRFVVAPGDVDSSLPLPPSLGGINWIHCWRNPDIPGSSQTRGLLDLDRALRSDAKWLRMRTWLEERASEWWDSQFGAEVVSDKSALLLRGAVLREALALAGAAPKDAAISNIAAEFLSSSEHHEAALAAAASARLAERELALKKAEEALQQKLNADKSKVRAFIVAALLACTSAASIASTVYAWDRNARAVQAERSAQRQVMVARSAQQRVRDLRISLDEALAENTSLRIQAGLPPRDVTQADQRQRFPN